ncbi:CPBP family intramembrane metalloprotease [Temperatibacter marinus]|uniref:CPBP family intramembrane metalloprotease n=1 Tax=Temperatibacter marinus TaxID=1456591 RepID=A0AA52HB86_9PROT|nr:CPBP family intramembrane glutamic endopeptidase [Temperatibacter marinus]WND03383.1 CPBP family intramembrane metalloprotease [Temperatibacter marinus]
MTTVGQSDLLPDQKVWKAIGLFLGLTALFSLPAYYMAIELARHTYYYVFMMWMPGLAALATCKIMGLSINSLGWKLGDAKWSWRSYFLPVLYVSIAYFIAYSFEFIKPSGSGTLTYLQDRFGLVGWSAELSIAFFIFILLTVVFVRTLAHTLGEEIGWRGFLVPQLMRKFGFAMTSLISGLIWALWHFPVLLYGNYANENLCLCFDNSRIWAYISMLVFISFPLTFYRLKSGSLWPSVIFHAMHNVMVYHLFESMTKTTKSGKIWVGEFGWLLPLITGVIALYFIKRAKEENFDQKLGS